MSWGFFRHHRYFPWVAAFLFLNLIVWQDGGANPASRFAAMRSVSEFHTFRIDSYRSWTQDWSRGPDGHYYSNKAPGAILLGLPITLIFDRISFALTKSSEMQMENGVLRHPPPGLPYKVFLSVLLQALPFAILALLCAELLKSLGVSPEGQTFAVLAMLFGNTASVLMNLYFGHALAAGFVLATCLALGTQEFFWAGAFFGFSVLTDYAAGLLLLPFALAALMATSREPKWKIGARAAAGGVFPGILWCFYHELCFGGIFNISLKYQNPDFAMAAGSSRLWGILSLRPDWKIVAQLLWGPTRGIAVTQPWVLLVFAGALVLFAKRWKLPREFAFPALLGLPLLIWANSGFNGWDGGYVAGPRYLSIVFPIFGVLAGFVYRDLPRIRPALWAGLAVSLTLRALVFTKNAIPCPNPTDTNLWGFYIHHFFDQPARATGTAMVFLGVFSAAYLATRDSLPFFPLWRGRDREPFGADMAGMVHDFDGRAQ